MSTAQLKNLAIFCGVVVVNIIVISVAAALGADTMPGFREGELFRPGRESAIGLLAIVAPIISGWIVQNRPRIGSERLAAIVDDYRERGYHKSDLTVVPKEALTGEPPATGAGSERTAP